MAFSYIRIAKSCAVSSAGYRNDLGTGQDLYGLSTDPYDLHPELYSRSVHSHGTEDASARLEDPKQQLQGFMGWQQLPAAHEYPSAGKLRLRFHEVISHSCCASHQSCMALPFEQYIFKANLMLDIARHGAARDAHKSTSVHAQAQMLACHAGRKRPAPQLQADRHRSEMLAEDHRDLLRGERWKLQRVRSLSTLPSDADLLASLKQGESATSEFPDISNLLHTNSVVISQLPQDTGDLNSLTQDYWTKKCWELLHVPNLNMLPSSANLLASFKQDKKLYQHMPHLSLQSKGALKWRPSSLLSPLLAQGFVD